MQLIPRVAIDFGSSRIRATVRDKDIPVYSTRSLVVREVVSGDNILFGDDAVDYILKPGQELIRPVKNGVLVDYRAAVSLIKHVFSEMLSWWHVFQPQVVVAESLRLSSAKSQAFGEAIREAGGGKIYMTSVPSLAALGAGIDPSKSAGNFIVDIGAGTTEAAVITHGSPAVSEAINIGGDEITDSLCKYIQKKYNVSPPGPIAENILENIGVALRRDTDSSYEFYVNESDTGDALALRITGNEVASAIDAPIKQISNLIADVIKRTPTTLLSDIASSGITITGGVGLMEHIDTYISRELAIPVHVASNPSFAVINGGRMALEYVSMYEQSIPQK